jgi:hypothetical protein
MLEPDKVDPWMRENAATVRHFLVAHGPFFAIDVIDSIMSLRVFVFA